MSVGEASEERRPHGKAAGRETEKTKRSDGHSGNQQSRHARRRSRYGGDPISPSYRLLNEFEARIDHSGSAAVCDKGDSAAVSQMGKRGVPGGDAQPWTHRDDLRVDPVIGEQSAGGASVFGDNQTHVPQYAQGPEGDVLSVPDGQ